MYIPNYLEAGSVFARLQSLTFKKQKKKDEETDLSLLDATLDLVLDLDDKVVDSHPGYLRGASEALRAAKDDKGTTVVAYQPLDRERAIRFSLSDGDFVAFEDVGTEVRLLELVATKGSSRFRGKFRVEGLTSEQCGRLLECWGKSVDASFEPVQIALPLAS